MKVNIKDTHGIDNQTFSSGKENWFITRLIDKAKDLPVQEMPISGLNTCHLYPHSNTMATFVNHIKKVLDADLSYPIILDDEGYVMDGRHRIAKALLEGIETIKFVRFDETPYRCYETKE